jgi:hypothetical protein
MWTTWGRTTCNMFGFAKGWTPRKFGTTPWTNSGLGWFLSKQIWTYSISLLDILIHGGMMVINWALCHWVSARPCLNRITLDGTGFWEGWVSKRWQLLQQQFYATICSHCTGRWWVVSLITRICGNTAMASYLGKKPVFLGNRREGLNGMYVDHSMTY